MAESSNKERYAWSSREIDILIAMWDNEDVLYNTRCVDYFKRDKRIEALERISDTLKIPIPEIRKKMTNLRTYYGKELWKEKKGQKNGEEDPSKAYHSRWQFFKPLDFLRENCNPRQNPKTDVNGSSDGVYDDDDDENDCDDTWDESNLLASLSSVGLEKEESREETVEEGDYVSTEHAENNNSSQKTSPMSKKVEKRKRSGEDIESVIAKLRKTSKTDSKDKQRSHGVEITEMKSNNPDMVFAHHVGLTLMNIKSPKMKDLAKLKIQQVLYETQYGEESTQSVQIQAFPITGLQVNT